MSKMGRAKWEQNGGAKWVSLNCAIFGRSLLSKKCRLIRRFASRVSRHRLFLWPAAFPIPPESLRHLADEATAKRPSRIRAAPQGGVHAHPADFLARAGDKCCDPDRKDRFPADRRHDVVMWQVIPSSTPGYVVAYARRAVPGVGTSRNNPE